MYIERIQCMDGCIVYKYCVYIFLNNKSNLKYFQNETHTYIQLYMLMCFGTLRYGTTDGASVLRRGRRETRKTQWRQGDDIYYHNHITHLQDNNWHWHCSTCSSCSSVCKLCNVNVCVQVKRFEICIIFTCFVFVYNKSNSDTVECTLHICDSDDLCRVSNFSKWNYF